MPRSWGRTIAGALLALLAVLAAGPSSAQAGELTGRLLVTLDRDQPAPRAVASAARAVAAKAGVRTAGAPLARWGVAVVRPAAGMSRATAVARLRADPRVARVELERRAQLRYVPNDPGFTSPDARSGDGRAAQWYLLRQGFPAAWDVARGEGATVAVIDSGVDAGHPDLAPRIRESQDFDATPGSGPATVDEIGHGTHVASLACAAADDARGIAGAGFGCDLLIAKSDFSDSSVAAAIGWAVEHGADAITMSFGTDGSRPAPSVLVRAIDDAVARGVVLVAAAADEPTEEQGDPANVLQPTGTGPDLSIGKGLSITAAGDNDQRASFAGYGSQISLAAYGTTGSQSGQGLLAAFPQATTDLERGSFIERRPPCGCRTSLNGDNRYAYLQGTSMSVPVVAGVAAMVRQFNPDLSALDVVRLIKETARNEAWEPQLGWGIVDSGAALAAARLADRRPPASRARGPRNAVRGRAFTLRWSGKDAAAPGVTRSGIASYEVWRSSNGGAPRKLFSTRKTSRRLRVTPGSRYGFFTIAVDRLGNREVRPARADATVRVAPQPRR